jgi:hypothetical protein
MNPIKKKFYSSNEQIKKFNEKIFYQSFENYSKYLNKLMKIYFNLNDNYDHFKFQIKLLSLTEQIKDLFKKFYQRYRIIVQIYLYQNLDQSILILSKYLLNQNSDYFYQFSFQQKDFFIFINIFFIYKE